MTSGGNYLIIFVRISLPNFVRDSNIDNIDNTKALRSSEGGGRVKTSPPEDESIRPQSSDNPKHGKQTVTTAIVMLDLIGRQYHENRRRNAYTFE